MIRSMTMFLALFWLNGLGLAADSAGEPGDETILVLGLRPIDVSDAAAQVTTEELTEQLANLSVRRVITAGEIDELVALQRTQLRLDCADEACIAEMSRAANARFVLSGALGRVGEEIIISLTLFDVEHSRSVASATETARSVEDLPTVLPALLADLLGLESTRPKRPTPRLPPGTELNLALFDLKALGIPPAAAKNLTQVLAAELKEVEGARVISRDDITSLLQLEARKLDLDCEEETDCLAEIGGALGVEMLVVGHAGKLGKRLLVSLRLINVRESVVVNRATESFEGVEEQLLPAVRIAGKRLLGVVDDEPGALAVTGPQAGAEIYLDEAPHGTTPQQPIDNLTPGRYALRLASAGFYGWRSDVYIEPGAISVIWVEMEEKPTRWVFWTTVGGTGLSLLGAALFSGIAELNASWYRDHLDNITNPNGAAASAQRDALLFRDVSYGLLVSTAVFAAATGVVAIFTDWD